MEYAVTTPQDVLVLLKQYQYLTIRQITKLLDKESTINNIREKVNRLIEDGLVDAESLPRSRLKGSAPFVYSLTKKGWRTLAEAGIPDGGKQSSVALSHILSINDVAILSHRISRQEPHIQLVELRHESVLKTHPLVISQKEKLVLVPDLFTQFLLFPPYSRGPAPAGILYEIDRGTETDFYTIKDKVVKYVMLCYGVYEQYFGGNIGLTIAFVVVTKNSTTRLRQLLTWAQQALQPNKADGEVFVFTACDPATISPLSFFTDPIWFSPFSSAPLPLIEKKQTGTYQLPRKESQG